jgi:hypothetical protein
VKSLEEACLEKLPTTTCEHSTHDPREELFDVERKVVRSVYDELVRKPMLAHFDERTEATFDS